MIDRRTLLVSAGAAAFAASAYPRSAAAERFPVRPITLIVAYAAGGGTDALARVFAEKLGDRLDVRVIVDNKAGAGGNLATEAAVRAKPDGYTLLIGNQGPMVVNPHIFKGMRVDPATDLDPIRLIADAALVVVASPKLGVRSLSALLEKARSGKLTYASASVASASHLAAALLANQAGFAATHVPYRGAGPALTDVLAGHVDFMVTTVPSVTGLVLAGQLPGLAVTSAARVEALPDIPTAAEAGLPGYIASAWYGLIGPKGIPTEIRATLAAAASAALSDSTLRDRLRDDGAAPATLEGESFARFMAEERARWGKVVADAGISL